MMLKKYLSSSLKTANWHTILFSLVVFVFAMLFRVIGLDQTSIFLDEAVYILIGKQALSGQFQDVLETRFWIGGFPFFYPTLSALFYSAGGIAFARLFTVVLSSFSAVLVFLFTKSLPIFKSKSKTFAGLIAAGLYASSSIPIGFSRIAIYDSLSVLFFFLFLFSLILAINNNRKQFFILAAISFFASFLAKYITLVFLPFFLLLTALVYFYKPLARLKQTVRLILKYFWYPLFVLLFLYFGINANALIEFYFGQALQRDSVLHVVLQYWEFSWPIYTLVLLSLTSLKSSQQVKIFLLFSLLSFIPLFFHVYSGQSDSVHQSLPYALILLLPLVTFPFVKLFERKLLSGILASFVLILIYSFISQFQVRSLESFWPDTSLAVDYLRKNVNVEDRILAEGDDVFILGLDGILSRDQIVGPFVFEYQGVDSIEAYQLALNDVYFKFVELDGFVFTNEELKLLVQSMGESYELSFQDGSLQIYEAKSS